ncbi:MAG: hypothetical protein PHR37_05800, partial [Eubacteriales bacterium]|nr:hypothetical protein [Eubacteriales bacterium]
MLAGIQDNQVLIALDQHPFAVVRFGFSQGYLEPLQQPSQVYRQGVAAHLIDSIIGNCYYPAYQSKSNKSSSIVL